MAGVVAGLRLGLGRVDGGALGLNHGQRAAVTVAQHVVGAGAIWQNHFVAHGRRVLRVPPLGRQQGVDLDAGVGFVRHVSFHAFESLVLAVASNRPKPC